MTTALGEKIKTIIRANGPISVTDYFSLCLADPQHGYYRTREPFGPSGDFVTAPEVSQLFGEMIGVFMVHAWQRHGTPPGVRLVEIGPGRGTMMSDMLRVIRRLAPLLYDSMQVHLVETSERLRDIQQETLQSHGAKVAWHVDFNDVPMASRCWPPTSCSMPSRSASLYAPQRAFASGWWCSTSMTSSALLPASQPSIQH